VAARIFKVPIQPSQFYSALRFFLPRIVLELCSRSAAISCGGGALLLGERSGKTDYVGRSQRR
jgi:hypothetical protein